MTHTMLSHTPYKSCFLQRHRYLQSWNPFLVPELVFLFPHLGSAALSVQSAGRSLAVLSQSLYFPAMPFLRRRYLPSFAVYHHALSFFPLIGLHRFHNFPIFLSNVLQNPYNVLLHAVLSDNLLLMM